jgi:serine protease AprX
MFSIKNKLEPNLRLALNKGYYKNYRVIILCSSLMQNIEKKIASYGGKILNSISYINCIYAITSTHVLNRLIEFL